MHAVHDIGGDPAGAIDRSEHRTFFDQRVDAMMRLVTHPSRTFWTVDAMRRANESHTAEQYFGMGYYERWLSVLRKLLVEQGVLTEQEIEHKLAALKQKQGR